ncbi:hypothetical protein KKHLCK_01460 [Candidatus Electrothrix laxa]
MRTENILRQDGFTLIETMMAMVVFTIGILGLFGMQSSAIKENLLANSITNGSTWAMDRVEQLLNLRYDDSLLDITTDDCDKLSDISLVSPIESGNIEPIYYIYVNVARGCTLSNVYSPSGTPEDEIYSPKHLRIIVTRKNNGVEKEFAVFNYIKQNVL